MNQNQLKELVINPKELNKFKIDNLTINLLSEEVENRVFKYKNLEIMYLSPEILYIVGNMQYCNNTGVHNSYLVINSSVNISIDILKIVSYEIEMNNMIITIK